MTQVKICGIASITDALAAVDFGADLLGFNFYPPSPRSISIEACERITSVINQNFPKIILVGVFVNMPILRIKSMMRSCKLDLAQLHGDESPSAVSAFHGKAFKAFRGLPTIEELDSYLPAGTGRVPAMLLDAAVQGHYGGSGQKTDWAAAAKLSNQCPILLAGGLNPDNVCSAVREVHPWGVDVASGVELDPGRKDRAKMKAFIQAVRSLD